MRDGVSSGCSVSLSLVVRFRFEGGGAEPSAGRFLQER